VCGGVSQGGMAVEWGLYPEASLNDTVLDFKSSEGYGWVGGGFKGGCMGRGVERGVGDGWVHAWCRRLALCHSAELGAFPQ
jgi:hypothetical protein